MLLVFIVTACLSAAFAGPAPVDAAEPVGFRIESTTVHTQGLGVHYRTSCPPGVTGAYRLTVTIAQRTGARVATAAGTLREPCAGRSRHVVLRTGPGEASFRRGPAFARVWGCAGAGCSEALVPLRVG